MKTKNIIEKQKNKNTEKKMKTTILVPILAISLLSACGAKSDSSPVQTTTSTVLIHGMSPEDFYKQFNYKYDGDCKHPEKDDVNFHFVTNERIYLDALPNGHEVIVRLSVYLESNNTYVMDYEEHEVLEYIELGYKLDYIVRERRKGTWAISEDGLLILNGLGVAKGLMYNNQPALSLIYTQDIFSPKLKGQNDILRMVRANHGRESRAETCQKMPLVN